MTLDEVIQFQHDHGLDGIHVIELGSWGFRLAHTSLERASTMGLHECVYHRWLDELEGPPREPGLYILTNSYEFIPISLCAS